MTQVLKENQTLARVREEIQRRAISQGAAAKEMGVSPTTLTQLLNGTYGADPSAQLEKLEKWLMAQVAASMQQSKLPPVPGWVSTGTAERIISALGYAQLAGDIAIVYGGAGLGKTTANLEYQRRFPNVWIATMTPASASVAASLEEICFALGMKNPPQGAGRMMREVVRRVASSGGLLIIDEAQHLSTAALDTIRSIHDATGIGIALVGNEAVYSRMTGGNMAPYLDRLFSRIGKRVRLTKPTKTDIERLANIFGVSDEDSLTWLKDIGRRAGALRSVVKVLRLATMIAKGESPSAADIEAAWKDLGV